MADKAVGLFVVDQWQRIREWDSSASLMLGIPENLTLGRPCYEVVAGRDASDGYVCRRWCRGFKALTRGWLGHSYFEIPRTSEPPLLARCEVMALPRATGGALVRLVIQGSRTSPNVEHFLSASSRQPSFELLRHLCALAALSSSLSVNPVPDRLQLALNILRQATGAEAAEIFRRGLEQKCMVLAAYQGRFRASFYQITHFQLGQGFPGLVWQQGKPVFTRDLQHDARYLRTRVQQKGFHSYVCVPLTSSQGVVGSVNLASRRPDFDLESALRLLTWASPPLSLMLQVAFPTPTQMQSWPKTAVVSKPNDAEVDTSPSLHIRCLGPFELYRQGQRIKPELVPLRKSMTLLKILLTYEGRPVSTDTLIDLLWPEAAPEAGLRRLHVLVHALRNLVEAPGPYRDWLFIKGGDGHYFFNLQAPCCIDVVEFQNLVAEGEKAEARGEVEAAIRAYESAIGLYRGDFLEDEPFAEWCPAKRQFLREVCLLALKRLAALCSQRLDWERSIQYLREALRMEPLQEEVHRELMRCLWAARRRDEALRQYQVCREILHRELEVDPLPETERLARSIASSPDSELKPTARK